MTSYFLVRTLWVMPRVCGFLGGNNGERERERERERESESANGVL